jgi:spermidine synthase
LIPWILLDTTTVPGGGALRLLRRGDEFAIRLGRDELMNSRMHGSEEALATLAWARIAGRARPRILIGGLGMGFTLRATLDAAGADARIDVAELVPAVVAWNRGPLAALSGHALADTRVSVHESDVAALIRGGLSAYDAILLDVDNGPVAMARAANDRLYDLAGLGTAHAALTPGGVLAVWSARPDMAFARRLRTIGFAVDEVRVRARGARGGPRHVVWIATRAGGAADGPRSGD